MGEAGQTPWNPSTVTGLVDTCLLIQHLPLWQQRLTTSIHPKYFHLVHLFPNFRWITLIGDQLQPNATPADRSNVMLLCSHLTHFVKEVWSWLSILFSQVHTGYASWLPGQRLNLPEAETWPWYWHRLCQVVTTVSETLKLSYHVHLYSMKIWQNWEKTSPKQKTCSGGRALVAEQGIKGWIIFTIFCRIMILNDMSW